MQSLRFPATLRQRQHLATRSCSIHGGASFSARRPGVLITAALALPAALAMSTAAGAQAPAAVEPSASAPAGSPAAIPNGGPFVYSLIADSSENIRAAVDRTVAHMSFITRPIARSRLNKVNPTPHTMRMDLRADSVRIAFDGSNPVVTPVNGDTVNWSNPLTHEVDRAHLVTAGDTLRQTIAAPDGQRENAVIFIDGGARVRLRVTVTSHRLPRPLVYELLFRRDTM